MPNRVLAQKALKLKTQRSNAMLGSRKRHTANVQALPKFSPKQERSPRDFTPKPTVPAYDPAMVQRFKTGLSGIKRA